ncbi:MAG: ABC transporter ATP-binding protein [Planctomycetes bacterium]|nr:ABC transporter ATP-binding protein [Planctomycetota bacterium]
MTDDPMIEARDVYHAYTHAGVTEPVLHGLELVVRRGEFVVIMGPSGCGKTTLLNILGLMACPTRAGTLRLAGEDALGLSDAARTRLRRATLGFVFQRFNLLPTISARQNVALPLRIRGEAADGRVAELLEAVGLQDCADKEPGRLSVGQQQRVAIARALVTRPALLLADEPTGNLDSANAEAVLTLLTEFHRTWRQTILLITHNEHLTVAADRVLRMCDGRFVE